MESHKRKRPNNSNTNTTNFRSAGIVFTNGKVVLAGYQRKIRNGREISTFISGIGGATEEGETPLQTAIRETVEEIYDFYSKRNKNNVNININNNNNNSQIDCNLLRKIELDRNMLEEIEETLEYEMTEKSSGNGWEYTFFVCRFDQLEKIMDIVNSYMINRNGRVKRGIISLAYPNGLPETIEDLLLEREDSCEIQEVISLCLLPVTKISRNRDIIKYDIKSDITKIMNSIANIYINE